MTKKPEKKNDEKTSDIVRFLSDADLRRVAGRAPIRNFSKKSKNIWAWLKITKTGWKISFLWLRK